MKKNYALQNLQIRPLTEQELLSIYEKWSPLHFPKNELKPVSSVQRMMQQGMYIGYGMYGGTENNLICYALFAIPSGKQTMLLDYFAVLEDYRSLGMGSLFLQYMKENVRQYDGLLIESEDPAFACDESDCTKRQKRLSFYSQNGALDTHILAHVFGVHYRLLYLPICNTPTMASIYSDFDAIYQEMVSKKNYETKIQISASFLP